VALALFFVRLLNNPDIPKINGGRLNAKKGKHDPSVPFSEATSTRA
jgi:hypothetical protein